jgi:hypothetical protein
VVRGEGKTAGPLDRSARSTGGKKISGGFVCQTTRAWNEKQANRKQAAAQ